jgi:hypothetical protein
VPRRRIFDTTWIVKDNHRKLGILQVRAASVRKK